MKSIALLFGSLSILLLSSSSASANTCSRADVDHYLKSGFTHAQVVQLCGSAKPAPKTVATQRTSVSSDEAIFFKSAIEAPSVEIGDDQMVYTRKECMKFGLPDMMGEKEELCRNVKTTINYQGLTIEAAHQGIPLIQDRELILAGSFTRELMEPESIPGRFKKDFFKYFVSTPETINVPVRKGFNPEEVGQRLIAKK
jgi:hypothetical protein